MQLSNQYKNNIIEKALNSKSKIILPEQYDPRIKAACEEMKSMGFNIIDIDNFQENFEKLKNKVIKKKFAKNWTQKMIDEYLSSPLIRGLLLLDDNFGDVLVAGAIHSTSDVIRSAIRIVGVDAYSKWVSSIFFMISPEFDKAYTYSDCGVIPEPDEYQLVSIAFNAANYHQLLSEEQPKVAFLSFSSKGSSDFYKLERIRKAVKIFKKKYPDIICDGELQFDAAIDSTIMKSKVRKSALDTNFNVFIFPDLNSGNIAYKITQYLANYSAWGPLLMGLAKPVHDLSRGCNIDDIICISSIACLKK